MVNFLTYNHYAPNAFTHARLLRAGLIKMGIQWLAGAWISLVRFNRDYFSRLSGAELKTENFR